MLCAIAEVSAGPCPLDYPVGKAAFYDGAMSSLHEQLAALRTSTNDAAAPTVEERLRALVATVLHVDAAEVTEPVLLDSLSRIEMALRIEDTFGLKAEDLHLDEQLSVAAVAKQITEAQSAAPEH